MFSKNIILRGILMQAVVNICCIAALVFGHFALESDSDWNTYFAHATHSGSELEKEQNDAQAFYPRLYGQKATEYLLKRSLKYEKIVNMFLVVYVICSVVYMISCLLNKTVGRNKALYEIFFTLSFFVLLIAMAMQFISMYTYDVNYIQWEIRNGKNVTQYNERTERFEKFYAKLYHPCTSESRLQMSEKDRLQLEMKFGPNACQFYDTKLCVLVLLTFAWIVSFLIIISVSECSHSSYNRVTPEVVLLKIIEDEEKYVEEDLKWRNKDQNDNLVQADEDADVMTESISVTTCKHSSDSCKSMISDNGNKNAERLLAKFRSELEVAENVD